MKNQTKLNSGFTYTIVEKLNKIGLSPLSLIMFILLGASPYLFQDEYITYLLATSLMFGTLGMGFDLSAGYINVANWGYAALMGLGAYTSALLLINLGVSPWIGMFIGAIFAALVGLLIGVLTLRMSGMYAAILAWFVGLILMSLATSLTDLTRGMLGLNVDTFFESAWATPYFYVIFIICVITFIVLRMLTRTNTGLAFTALGQDVEAARASGVDPLKYKVINFTISSFIAGLIGGFYAHFIGILTPDVMHTKHTVEILVIAFVGGRKTIWGPLLAAFLIIPVFQYLNFLMELKFIIYGIMLILVMIVYPRGLAGLLEQFSDMVKNKLKGNQKVVGQESDHVA